MKISTKTGLLIISVVVLLFVVAAILTSLFSNSDRAPNAACIHQLRVIDAAKQIWASENHKTNGPVTWNDILPHLWNDPQCTTIPRCPKQGSYTLGSIGELPTCSVPGHKLP